MVKSLISHFISELKALLHASCAPVHQSFEYRACVIHASRSRIDGEERHG